MDKHTKRGGELKALDDAGHGMARIATLSAVDHDKDTYAPGAFGEQWAQMLGVHEWRMVPIGKARVFEQGDEAFAELHMNLNTQAGKDWHAALKFDLDGCCGGAPAIQEWSYGYYVLDSAQETRGNERVRVMKKLDVYEVSPVVRGAGVGTGTLAMKSGKQNFGEQLDAAIADMADILTRARAIKDLRSQEGRGLSATRLKQLVDLDRGLAALIAEAKAEERLANDLYARHIARQIGHRLKDPA